MGYGAGPARPPGRRPPPPPAREKFEDWPTDLSIPAAGGDGADDSDGGPVGDGGGWQNQPRVPAGNPDGGQWTDGGGSGGGAQDGASQRWIAASLEERCEKQLERDEFQCKMVGLRSCYAQAMQRYAACLRGQPIPPFNY